MEYIIKLNNKICPPPANFDGIEIELNFDSGLAEITATEFEWKGENATVVNKYIEDGKNGGFGIFEGMPLSVELTGNSQSLNVFDGYIDFTENAEFSCYFVKGTLKKTGGLDFLNDRADSFRFPYLYQEGIIKDSDFREVAYVVSSIPDYAEVVLGAIGIFVIVQTLIDVLQKIAAMIETAFGYIGTQPILTGEAAAIIYLIVMILLNIAYVIFLIDALLNLTEMIIDMLIQPIKHHKGMYVKTLCERACEHLGLEFSSSIFESNPYVWSFILPQKNKKGRIDNEADNSEIENGLYNETFGNLLRSLKNIFNANVRIIDNVLHLERKDYWKKLSTFKVPDVLVEKWKYNTQDLVSNYVLEFQTDTLDLNTIDFYKGTIYQETLSFAKVNNRKHVLIKNLKNIKIPFARMVTKKKLTEVEEIVSVMIDTFNLVADLLSWENLFAVLNGLLFLIWRPKEEEIDAKINQINSRIGMMALSSDFVGVPKFFLRRNDSLDELLTAKNLYENFHFINSFMPSNEKPNANQYKVYEDIKVPFCLCNAIELLNNNFITDASGKQGEMIKIKWSFTKNYALISYKINKLYTTNLKQTFYESI